MHYTWEQMSHVPTTSDESAKAQDNNRKQRYNQNKTRFQLLMKFAGDNIQKIHRIGYDEPEECTTPCAVELPWAIPELPLSVYAQEGVLPLGCGLAFDYYKEYLQMISWQQTRGAGADTDNNNKTWMLKCPFHLPYLKELFETFPDATVVWTHRDPVECIASACSLYETLAEMGIESWSIDKKALGKAVLQYTKRSLDMAESAIKEINSYYKNKKSSPVIHVRYADNIKDPKSVCASILNQAGVLDNGQASQKYNDKVEEYIVNSKSKRAKEKTLNKTTTSNKKSDVAANTSTETNDNKSKSKGAMPVLHLYSLEEYGLSLESVREEFKSYTDKYNLVNN